MSKHEALARVIADSMCMGGAVVGRDGVFRTLEVAAAAVVEFLTSDEAGLCAECVEKVRAL